MTVRSVDHGYDALVKRIFGFKQATVAAGILAKDGAKPHKAPGAEIAEGVAWTESANPKPIASEDEDLTVIEVACWNEFGTEHIPARSFVRAWFDEHQAEIREKLRRLMLLVVSGKRTKKQILEQLGAWCAGEIQRRMAEGVPPPNAQSTIDRKGSSTPLIATGQMRSSVSYRTDAGDGGDS